MPKLTLVPTRTLRRRPDPLLRNVIGAVLRAERGAQQRTLSDVALAARVSLPYLSEVERGRKEPSSEVLAAILAALDLGLADVLARTRSHVVDLTGTSTLTSRTSSSPTSSSATSSSAVTPSVSLSLVA